MWQMIGDLVARGVTIFLTTHYLEEADELADKIAVLDRGRVIAEGSPEELKRLIPGGHIALRFGALEDLQSAANILDEHGRNEDVLTLQIPGGGSVRSIRSILDQLDSAAIEVESLSVHTPDLDDVFLTLTGQIDSERETAQ
jgi:ABC-2 type transport system ATP-binding protein